MSRAPSDFICPSLIFCKITNGDIRLRWRIENIEQSIHTHEQAHLIAQYNAAVRMCASYFCLRKRTDHHIKSRSVLCGKTYVSQH